MTQEANECMVSGQLVSCLYPDLVDDQAVTNKISISTTRIREVCPGVKYFSDHNKTETAPILQVNVSDCNSSLPHFTAQSGVMYGVCGESSTFCKMHVRVRRPMHVRLRLRRLEYWCDSVDWKTTVDYENSGHPKDDIACDYHSHKEIIHQSPMNKIYIGHTSNPLVKISFVKIEYIGPIIEYLRGYFGHLILSAPLSWPRLTIHGKLNGPYGHVIMISLLQTTEGYGIDLKMRYRETESTQDRRGDVEFGHFTPARVFPTSHLSFEMIMVGDNAKMHFSTLPGRYQPRKMSSGLFNCSVTHYSLFQDHLDCNLRTECEDGRDETEHCPFSSAGCQGLVASRRKCFSIAKAQYLTIMNHGYLCRGVGGRLLSLKTRKEQEDSLHLFKRRHRGFIVLALTSGLHIVPFMYSKFRKWSDNTLIYNMNHFRVQYPYFPARLVWSGLAASMALVMENPNSLVDADVMCETDLPSQTGLQLSTPSPNSRLSKLKSHNTRQLLFMCPDKHLTHAFLTSPTKRDSGKAASRHQDVLGNVTGRPHLLPSGGRMIGTLTPSGFPCDDGISTVHYSFVCDFTQHCPDNSDESFCEHSACPGFLCSNAQCVLHGQRCNEYSDCQDDSDEVNCTDTAFHFPPKDNIKKQEFHINLDGTGYFTQEVMTSEDPCPDTHYRCTAEWLYCLPLYTQCNGFSDCVYGEDEQNCGSITCSYYYLCRDSNVCLHVDHLCDGWGQCPQKDDELTCDRTCPEGCLCQGHSLQCNKHFPADSFPHLRYVDAAGSGMFPTEFYNNGNLVYLNLFHCFLDNTSHLELRNLQVINLANNLIESLDLTVFLDLPNLRIVSLQNNPLQNITSRLKPFHYALRRIDISKTRLSMFKNDLSAYLIHVKYLNLSFSVVDTIGSKGFKSAHQLIKLDLKGNPLNTFPPDLFSRSYNLKYVYSSDHRVCCEEILPKQQSTIKCSTVESVLPSCSTLIPSELYLILFWLMFASATIGTLFCFVISFAVTKTFRSKFLMVIVHLHLADICMGCHVGIVLAGNMIYQGRYTWFERTWTRSVTCNMGGFLFFLSKEVSVFVILLITVDHTIIFCFPRNSSVFDKRSTTVTGAVLWLVGILLSLIPFLPGLSHWGLSGQSGLCRLSLFQHYQSNKKFAWFKVTASVNFTTCLVIMACECVIQKRTPKYRIVLDPTKRFLFSCVHLMKKVSFTEVVCWFLFGTVTLLATCDVNGADKIQGILVVFMLPLTSALNPVLYVWTALTQYTGQKREEKLIHVLNSRLNVSSKTK